MASSISCVVGWSRISPPGGQVSRVELLHAGRNVPFGQSDGKVEFIMPSIVDYEIAAMYGK